MPQQADGPSARARLSGPICCSWKCRFSAVNGCNWAARFYGWPGVTCFEFLFTNFGMRSAPPPKRAVDALLRADRRRIAALSIVLDADNVGESKPPILTAPQCRRIEPPLLLRENDAPQKLFVRSNPLRGLLHQYLQ